MEVQGFIKKVLDAQQVSEKFTKREIWVETTDQYPQTLNIQFTQDKCSVLDGFKVGESVKIGINLNGRTWTSPQGEEKCFNTITGWRIEKTEGNQESTLPPAPSLDVNADSDLPF